MSQTREKATPAQIQAQLERARQEDISHATWFLQSDAYPPQDLAKKRDQQEVEAARNPKKEP